MSKQKKFPTFVQNVLVPVSAVVGLPAAVFCLWFQSEGFTIVKLVDCLNAVLIGTVLGVGFSLYLRKQTKEENAGKKLREKDLDKMIRGMVFCFLLLLGASFLASSVLTFLISIGGTFMLGSVLLLYFIRRLVLKKKEEQEK